MAHLLKRLLGSQSGATAIEYGLVVALIAVSIMVGLSAIGGNISNTLNSLGTQIAAK